MKHMFCLFFALWLASVACLEPVNVTTTSTPTAAADDTPTATVTPGKTQYAEVDAAGGIGAEQTCVVAATSVHVRREPTEHSPALGWAVAGDVLRVLETAGAWGRVEKPAAGWVRMDGQGAQCR